MKEMSQELKKFIKGNIVDAGLTDAERLDRAMDLAAHIACGFMLEDKVELANQYARIFDEARDLQEALEGGIS